jgi:thioredoxin reductase (NADPH)
MRAQAERFGCEFITDDVTSVDLEGDVKTVRVGDETYQARAVIVATGATARQLGLASEQALQGRGVSYCAVCDAAFFRGKRVVVVGGGDSAFEEAVFLARFASQVALVHRRGEFRASRILVERARSLRNLRILTPYVVSEVLGVGEGRVTGVVLSNPERTEEEFEVVCDGVFVAIGHDPTTGLFHEQLPRDRHGYLLTGRRDEIVGHGETATMLPGVFAAGDVADSRYRQAVTAAASGCQAALDAERYLANTAA